MFKEGDHVLIKSSFIFYDGLTGVVVNQLTGIEDKMYHVSLDESVSLMGLSTSFIKSRESDLVKLNTPTVPYSSKLPNV